MAVVFDHPKSLLDVSTHFCTVSYTVWSAKSLMKWASRATPSVWFR